MQDLQWEHHVNIARYTARNRLYAASLHSRRSLRYPPFSWCNQNWGEHEWATVLVTAESRIGFHPDSQQVRVWRRFRNVEHLWHVQDIYTYRCDTLMQWGVIMIRNRNDLVFSNRSYLRFLRQLFTHCDQLFNQLMYSYGQHNPRSYFYWTCMEHASRKDYFSYGRYSGVIPFSGASDRRMDLRRTLTISFVRCVINIEQS